MGKGACYSVVSDDDEEGIVVPRLATRRLEELTQCHIRIGYGLVHRDCPLGEYLLILVGHTVGMVRGEGELGCEEGLTECAELTGYVLQELFIPDAPVAIVVLVVGVLGLAVVVSDTRLHHEGIEAHRAIGRTVEEGGGVAH